MKYLGDSYRSKAVKTVPSRCIPRVSCYCHKITTPISYDYDLRLENVPVVHAHHIGLVRGICLHLSALHERSPKDDIELFFLRQVNGVSRRLRANRNWEFAHASERLGQTPGTSNGCVERTLPALRIHEDPA